MECRPSVSLLFLFLLASFAAGSCNGFAITKGGGNRLSITATNPSLSFSSSISKISNTAAALSPPQARKSKEDDILSTENESGDKKKKLSPATYVIAPFIFIFGLDIVLNILVVTKRSLEVAFTGEYTVWTPWQ